MTDDMPAEWLIYGLSITEDSLPPANVIDRSGDLPKAIVRPIAERMFFELCSHKELEVYCDGLHYMIRKRSDEYAVFLGKMVVGGIRKFETSEVLELLSYCRPVLRLIEGEQT